VTLPADVAHLIRRAFLPLNPNKMRNAAPEVVAAAHQFIAATGLPKTMPLWPEGAFTAADGKRYRVVEVTDETKAPPDPKGMAVIRAAQLDLAAQSLDRNDCHTMGEACREAASLLRGFAGVATEKASATSGHPVIACIYRDGCRKFPACMNEARCCGRDTATPDARDATSPVKTTAPKAGYMGDINGPGCDPDVP
jgi:hypothetical protein